MFVLRTLIEKYTNQGSKLHACFVDFAKAFDSVMHTALLYKLVSSGISGLFYNIIKSMYTDNKMHVRIGDRLSESFSPEIGLRQGDNLSPNLFKLFINDLTSCFDCNDDPVLLGNMKLNCLLYADDVVLFSTSEKGLQNCLNKLNNFSNNHGISVNLKKTCIMTFCKNGKVSNVKYWYNDIEVKHVTTYKYLGILFSATGNFSPCKVDLYRRASKANFKLCKYFNNLNINVRTMLHLFDNMVKPVLLYGSEIWSTINTNSTKINKDNFSLFSCFDDMPCEKLHLKFMKFAVGVHKKACNDGVYGELGRFPLYFSAIVSCMKYFIRITQPHCSQLLSNAFAESKLMYVNGKRSWVSSTYFILKHLNIRSNHYNDKNLPALVLKTIVKNYKIKFNQKLSNMLHDNNGKLRTYALFKSSFNTENYFDILKNRNTRACLTRFRISSHRLQIEVGRYNKTPRQQRFCEICNSGEVEDEIHFITSCSSYNNLRNIFYQEICSLNNNFSSLSDKNKFIWLMSNENEGIVHLLAGFINDCYRVREGLPM